MVRSIDKGEFDKPRAAAGFFTILSLYCAAGACGTTVWIYALLAAMVMFGVLVPWLDVSYVRKLHQQLDDGYIQQCRDAVQRDTDNAGAHGLLAEAYAQNCWIHEAVQHYEVALTLSPDPDFNPQYDVWVRRLEAARAAYAQLCKRRPLDYCPWWKLRA